MQHIHHYASPLGPMTMASDGTALSGLWFDGQKYFGAGLAPSPSVAPLPVFDAAVGWLDLYFSGQRPGFLPPLRLVGTGFQRMVWNLLLSIPYGTTVSYKDIARRVAALRGTSGMAAQAVGSAVGHNPISLIVPCHRVVGSNGSLTGYAGGIGRKAWLLEHEGCGRLLP
ncbi:methylated-DNA--[protein]-cysteine S-methyltransferase [Prevotella dentasini]|uniref:methylated-DNA--[protein]-cysteine S-methyltransferase n=1 Tax=Prevotella dentasini TaxID=589537 RepID=UPI00055B1934|nr:methylated-DNA--[protein]-cysteine S-methyltransferase [Prevotella dentasini]